MEAGRWADPKPPPPLTLVGRAVNDLGHDELLPLVLDVHLLGHVGDGEGADELEEDEHCDEAEEDPEAAHQRKVGASGQTADLENLGVVGLSEREGEREGER